VSSNDRTHLPPQDVAYTDQWNYDIKEKPVVVKATVTVLGRRAAAQLDMPADSSGARVLKAITLEDTNVKFTIDQNFSDASRPGGCNLPGLFFGNPPPVPLH
jgi:hypothetical protein